MNEYYNEKTEKKNLQADIKQGHFQFLTTVNGKIIRKGFSIAIKWKQATNKRMT